MDMPQDAPMLNNPLTDQERALLPDIDLAPDTERALALRVSGECFGTCQLHHEV